MIQTLSPVLTSLLLCLAASASPLAAQDGASGAIDHLEERLQYLADDYQQALQDNNIPGMAVAVVLDDEIIFARGFGVADMQSGRKVTPETGFAIGSTTKAFTSVLIGMLVDEGKMEWDAPITEYLPYFKLRLDTDEAEAQATIRDLLCHRTGFTRMGLLWAAGLTSTDEILRTATLAESWDGFRKNFHYNNVMYLAAGEASAQVAGTSWNDLLKSRLLKPLGMKTSDVSITDAMKNPNMALGYSWHPDLKQHKREEMRNIDAIAPAGAINSNVIEMCNWIRMQLALGEFEGKRLISEEALSATWEENITVGGPVKYGMGWMMTNYDGQQALHHGGNIDGFAAAVALLPESGMGYVMLTNISATALQAPTSTMVWDALLKDFEPRLPKPEPVVGEFDDFLGIYVGNFASFSDADFTVSTRDGALYVDIPGQLDFELLPADEQGKRAIKLSPVAQFRFVSNPEGPSNIMELHQGGSIFELHRRGHKPELDLPLEELEVFFGKYRVEGEEMIVVLKEQNGHLAADVPGQMVFEMNLPNDEGLWMFRAVPGIGIEFEFDDDGLLIAAIQHQRGKTRRLERLQEAAPKDNRLPGLAELDELRNMKSSRAARASLGTCRRSFSINLLHSGVEGSTEEIETLDGRFFLHTKLGKFGYSKTGFDGKTAWTDSAFDTYDEPDGRLRDQLLLSSNAAYFGDWKETFDKVRVLRSEALDGVEHWVVELTKGSLPAATVYLNRQTGDITRTNTTIISGGSGSMLQTVSHMSDYREVNGLRFPFHVRTENDSSGATIIQFKGMETNVEVSAELFKPRQ